MSRSEDFQVSVITRDQHTDHERDGDAEHETNDGLPVLMPELIHRTRAGYPPKRTLSPVPAVTGGPQLPRTRHRSLEAHVKQTR